ncbi:hypothetical protein IFM89_019938 [Coptis chinensis]|uniref:Uncharacterized protein n=1 Tax=Coptis chinensis TaxID=261450 RepID=A0A835I501_9MAGN|nr:hypothetical protein IFM89_019938 [Coptis chinensis]
MSQLNADILVGRLSQEELMAQLSSFLPALFDAFGNQSADVRKEFPVRCAMSFPRCIDKNYLCYCGFCLVDIYIMLGKSFLPYLEGLNSTQLRLVTIYANRISQASVKCVILDGVIGFYCDFGLLAVK